MDYNKLNTQSDSRIRTLAYHGDTIKVKTQLASKDIVDLIDVVFQKSIQNGIYNDYLMKIYFELNLVYLCSDIKFTDEDRADELRLYDELSDCGLLTAIIGIFANESDQYTDIWDCLEEMKISQEKANLSVVALLSTFIKDLPINAEKAVNALQDFDPSKYQSLVEFAMMANGSKMP